MELLSLTYGWTPDQIRALSAADVEQYLVIIAERGKIEEARAFKAKGSKHGSARP